MAKSKNAGGKSDSQATGRSKEKRMAKTKQPNILVIWGDDIGISNLSCYSHGLMGYQRPTSTASRRKA